MFESARPWRVCVVQVSRGSSPRVTNVPSKPPSVGRGCRLFISFLARAPEVNLLSGPWRGTGRCPCNKMTQGMPTGCKWTTSATSPVKAASLDRFFGWPWDCGSFASEVCARDFDTYECSVISDDTLQAVGEGILDGNESVASSPRARDPARR